MENGKLFTILGWVATATAIGMYVSYIPQISDNLAGHKSYTAFSGSYQLFIMGSVWLFQKTKT